MSVLDDLIRIKTNKQEDDLLKMLDEIPVYEKLSADVKLRDLKTSEVTRKKCPMLAGFIDGKIYETTLADLVANVYLQIEGTIPPILQSVTHKTAKQQRQIEILQAGIARVDYREITEYDHEEMKGLLTAVFTKKEKSATTVALIIKAPNGYTMYHGTYTNEEVKGKHEQLYAPVTIKGAHGVFSMESYSVLGNNGYKIGTYSNEDASYGVMIGPDGILYLMNDGSGDVVTAYTIPWEERNNLNIAKKEPKSFAEAVTGIIESVV